MNLEKFSGISGQFPQAELHKRLDRNFQTLSKTDEPTSVTSGFTFTNDDHVDSLQVNATSAAITVYLPEQPVGRRRRRIVKTDSSANAVTVDGNSNTINGATTYVLNSQYEFVEVEPTGTAWIVISYG